MRVKWLLGVVKTTLVWDESEANGRQCREHVAGIAHSKLEHELTPFCVPFPSRNISIVNTMGGWFPNHCLKTLASWYSLRLLPVCPNLTAKTMYKERNYPRILLRNPAMGV